MRDDENSEVALDLLLRLIEDKSFTIEMIKRMHPTEQKLIFKLT